jgi:hypothetical protein
VVYKKGVGIDWSHNAMSLAREKVQEETLLGKRNSFDSRLARKQPVIFILFNIMQEFRIIIHI